MHLPTTSTKIPEASGDLHICDNYAHLVFAVADAARSAAIQNGPRPLIVYLDDRLPLGRDLRESLSTLADAEIVVDNDHDATVAFARLPERLPAELRRNLSWSRGRPVRPLNWIPEVFAGRRFETGFVYHPGFFMSKVAAGRCDHVVMRDSGYANYVRHRVPVRRWPLRLAVGRPPRWQTWGEEPWVDKLQVARPDRVPVRVRHKASRVTLDDIMKELPVRRARAIAQAFWNGAPPERPGERPQALILTQPIDELGICSSSVKAELYHSIATRLQDQGFDIVVKPHPREVDPALGHAIQLPASFPIEAWTWLGQRSFDLAVSLNSTALVDPAGTLAAATLQLIDAERFYPAYVSEWPATIDRRLRNWEASLDEADAIPGRANGQCG